MDSAEKDKIKSVNSTTTEAVESASVTESPSPIQQPGSQKTERDLIKVHGRSKGLWILDAVLYPVVNNALVFGLSVVATYLTKRGGDLKDDGTLKYGEVGKFFNKRGVWLENQFQEKANMSAGQADMAKMGFFSFPDGT